MSHSEKAIPKDKELLKRIKLRLSRYEKKFTSKDSSLGEKLSSREKRILKDLQKRILTLEKSIQNKDADNIIEQQKSKQQEEVYKKVVFIEDHKYLTMNWKLYERDTNKKSNLIGNLDITLRFEKFSFANTSWWVLENVETISKIQSGGIYVNASVSSFSSASSKSSMLQTELNIQIKLSTEGIKFSKGNITTEGLKRSLNLSLGRNSSKGVKDVSSKGLGLGANGGWEWSDSKQESWQTAQSSSGASFTRGIQYKFQSQNGKLKCKVLKKKNVRVDLFDWGQEKTVKSILEKLYHDDTTSEVELMDLIERLDDSNFLKGI